MCVCVSPRYSGACLNTPDTPTQPASDEQTLNTKALSLVLLLLLWQDSIIEMQDCNSTSNSATLGGSIYMSRSELDLRKCLFVGDTVRTRTAFYF